MSTKRMTTLSCAVLMLFSGMISCNSLKKLTREEKGAAIGVGSGAVLGGILGANSKNPAVYAIIGSAIGGVAGVFVGKYMDKQAEKLEKDLAKIAKVERIEEGIKITMSSGLLFDVDSYTLSNQNRADLAKLASTLDEYEDTEILVAGHTDNTGSDEYNLKLSQNRADAVASYLSSQGVKKARFVVKGYGESNPEFDNSTKTGQDKNRRVELAIVASDKLKRTANKEAKKGA